MRRDSILHVNILYTQKHCNIKTINFTPSRKINWISNKWNLIMFIIESKKIENFVAIICTYILKYLNNTVGNGDTVTARQWFCQWTDKVIRRKLTGRKPEEGWLWTGITQTETGRLN